MGIPGSKTAPSERQSTGIRCRLIAVTPVVHSGSALTGKDSTDDQLGLREGRIIGPISPRGGCDRTPEP